MNWKDNEAEIGWYYNDLEEFNQNYKKGNKAKDVGTMFVFKGLNGKLPLAPYLEEIKLDNPGVIVNYKEGREEELSKIVTDYFDEILNRNGFGNIPKKLRHKNNFADCTCWIKYKRLLLEDINELRRLYHFEGK